MGGQHIHYRVARVEADAAVLVRAARNAQAALLATARRRCTCMHPADDHELDSGCLHGWGKPPADGCPCEGTPS